MRRSLLATACAVPLLAASCARAQTVDYGALEEIFGQPVTTSATGKPQKVSDVPANMEIITQDQIRQSGADNIPDALQYVTGINFRRNGMNEPDLSIRGYDTPWNPRLLVLINGQPAYEDFFGDVVWAALPVQLDEIRQIEIVKGPTAALFGFNAISGVINIVTYDPLYDQVASATARAGTQNLREGSAVASYGESDKYGVKLSVGGTQEHEFPLRALPVDDRLSRYYQPYSSSVSVDGKVRLSEDWVASANGYDSGMTRNFYPDGQIESDRTWSGRAQLAGTTGIGIVNLDGYYTHWTFDFPYLQQAVSHTIDFRASDLFKIGADHSFRLSAEYKYNEANGQFASGSTDFYSIYAVGAMWDWTVDPQLELTNAVREDYLTLGFRGGIIDGVNFTASDFNNRVLNATSINSGVTYQLTPDDEFRLLYSRGFQLPSLDVMGMQIGLGGGVVLEGDPHTQAVQVNNYEADYDRAFAGLGAKLRTAVYHQTNDNLFNFLVLAPYYSPASLQSSNAGNSNETGFELTLSSLAQAPFRWSLGYSYATISDHLKSSVGAVIPETFSVYSNGTPTHTLNGSVGATLGRWELDLKAGWRSHLVDWAQNQVTYLFYPVTVKDYATVDLHASYRITDGLRLGLTVDDATQQYTRENANVPVQRRIFGTLNYHL